VDAIAERSNATLSPASIVYPLGFIFSPGQVRSIPSAYRQPFPDLNLFVHPRTRLVRSEADATVVLLGIGIHEDDWGLSQQQVANQLGSALAQSRDALLAFVAGIAGRYAIIFLENGRWKVMNDAIGMRTVFFGNEGPDAFVGSHIELVASQMPSAGEREPIHFMWGYPGLMTPRHNVSWLVPNNILDLAAGTMERIFPLHPIPPRTAEEAANQCAKVARSLFAALTSLKEPLAVSLTAGRDSRTTLAMSLPYSGRIKYFTYWYDTEDFSTDLNMARDLCTLAGVEHIALTELNPGAFLSEADRNAFLEQVKVNSYGRHLSSVLPRYFGAFGQWEYVHLRSNMFELGRASFQHRYPRLNPKTPEAMAAFYVRNGGKAPAHIIEEAFQDYYTRANSAQALNYISALDLYFIEHRMPVWQGNVALETDCMFETLILLNSRNTVSALLGVPLADRLANRVFNNIISDIKPELLSLPFNPDTWPPRDLNPA
jgi:hypothetical protein